MKLFRVSKRKYCYEQAENSGLKNCLRRPEQAVFTRKRTFHVLARKPRGLACVRTGEVLS